MGHKQGMNNEKRLALESLQYKATLNSRKGHNYEYWTTKHYNMLTNGWILVKWVNRASRQWSNVFLPFAISMEEKALQKVEELRNDGFYARIICGYEKNKQRTKMFSVIYKPKKATNQCKKLT